MFNKILIERGIELKAGFGIKMVANGIGFYDMPKQVKNILKKSQIKIDLIAEKIKQKKNKQVPRSNPLFFWKDKMVIPFLKSLPTMNKDFNVSENCTGCGICGKVCPVRNIEMVNNRPVFKHICEQCVACVQLCPSKALNIENKTQSRRRYINPDITINEIINGYTEETTLQGVDDEKSDCN
jgi:ferredoxin